MGLNYSRFERNYDILCVYLFTYAFIFHFPTKEGLCLQPSELQVAVQHESTSITDIHEDKFFSERICKGMPIILSL